MDASVLDLDLPATVDRICARIKESAAKMGKRGAVVAISGGIDSSVCATLSARALGREHVFVLILPERDSSARSGRLGRMLADHLHVEHIVHDIAPTLEAIGCYRWRDEAIRAVFPEYGDGWKNKIVISGGLEGRHQLLQARRADARRAPCRRSGSGPRSTCRSSRRTNFKQRIRKTVEYFHADRLNYAVIGTPNRLEYDQGFFVKNGDGSADMKPIAHLYKTQVYALARHLGLPDGCRRRAADDGHLQPGAGTGRVLLRAAVRADGPGAVGAEPRAAGEGAGGGAGASPSSRPSTCTATSRRSGERRATCTRGPSWSSPSKRSSSSAGAAAYAAAVTRSTSIPSLPAGGGGLSRAPPIKSRAMSCNDIAAQNAISSVLLMPWPPVARHFANSPATALGSSTPAAAMACGDSVSST